MNEVQGEPTQDRKGLWHRAHLPALVVAFTAFNVLLDPAETSRSGGFRDLDAVLLGVYVSQVCLIAGWAALGATPLASRILSALLTLFVVTLARLVVESLFELQPEGVRYSTALMIGALMLTFVLSTAALSLIRVYFGLRLTHSRLVTTTGPSRGQFGLRHLILLITLVAVIMAVVRGIGLFDELSRRLTRYDLLYDAVLPGVLLTFFFLPVAGVAMLVLRTEFSLRELIVALGVLFGSSALAYGVLYLMMAPLNSDVTVRLFLMQVGAALCCFVVAALVRMVGFRIATFRQGPSTTTPPEPVD